MFRTADAAGVSKLYLTGFTSAPADRLGNFRPQIVKVALGAEKSVPWEVRSGKGYGPALRLICKLKKSGYKVYALERSPQSIPYYKIKTRPNSKIALVVGNEVNGLSPAVLCAADKILEIPMLGKKESLNVSVAFGIALFGLRFPRG